MNSDVEDEEERPDDLRDLVARRVPSRRRTRSRRWTYSVRDDAEDDGEDAADEDREEVVDARSAAAQPVEALELEGERHEHRDERQRCAGTARAAASPA